MKAACKLCGTVIETDPDPNMDEGREQREKNQFWNRVAFHIDPKNRICHKEWPDKDGQGRLRQNDRQLAVNRFTAVSQDNGWFQRWRLLACLDNLDVTLTAKQEEWREYLHLITAAPEADAPAASTSDAPEAQSGNNKKESLQ